MDTTQAIPKQKTAPSTAVSVTIDVLWCAIFIAAWAELIVLWNTWFAPALVIALGVLFAGLSELMHQCAHYGVFGRHRAANRIVGKIAGAIVTVDLVGYRPFHIKHHQTANLAGVDPEEPLYADPEYLRLVRKWSTMDRFTKYHRTSRLIQHTAKTMATFGHAVPFVRYTRLAVPFVIAAIGLLLGSGWMVGLQVLVCWFLPLKVFEIIDFFLVQSEHYRTPATEGAGGRNIVDLEKQRDVSWNIRFPWLIEILLMGRNLHAAHHAEPGKHWSFQGNTAPERDLGIVAYLKRYWIEGPRHAD